MDEETRKRAVEPFFSTKGIGRGTGLGLSMVHGLAAQLGGALIIDSVPDHGTTIELWLPMSANEPEIIEDARQGEPYPAYLGTALLVDDEELVRMSTADMLSELGYQVVEANSAENALQLVRNGLTPDILVTDHLMPGMNGADLVRELKTIHPMLSALIVSGYADEKGIDVDIPRLTKPFRNSELAACLLAITTISD